MSVSHPTWLRRWPGGLVVALATLGPIGQRLAAPGTWGSLVGVGYFWLVFLRTGPAANILLNIAGFFAAVVICDEAERRLGKSDPGEVILDEFVAMPLCYIGWGTLLRAAPVWVLLAGGFVLFRFFDILKPLGISRLQRLPGGWGVVVDDTVAALAACLTLHLAAWGWLHR